MELLQIEEKSSFYLAGFYIRGLNVRQSYKAFH